MTKLELKLYIAGNSAISRTAIRNLKQICETNYTDGYTLEIVDVVKEPDLIETEKIIATPTLIKISPGPEKRFIGDFSNARKIIESIKIS